MEYNLTRILAGEETRIFVNGGGEGMHWRIKERKEGIKSLFLESGTATGLNMTKHPMGAKGIY